MNSTTARQPNGAVYGYENYVVNRLTKESFKETETGTALTLMEYSYEVLPSGNTTITTKLYFDNTNTAETKITYDYAGREIKVDYPDGSYTTKVYNANGTLASSSDARGNATLLCL